MYSIHVCSVTHHCKTFSRFDMMYCFSTGCETHTATQASGEETGRTSKKVNLKNINININININPLWKVFWPKCAGILTGTDCLITWRENLVSLSTRTESSTCASTETLSSQYSTVSSIKALPGIKTHELQVFWRARNSPSMPCESAWSVNPG